VFAPISELLKSAKLSVDRLENPPCDRHDSQSEHSSSRRPLHARLPDELDDELPVHNTNDT